MSDPIEFPGGHGLRKKRQAHGTQNRRLTRFEFEERTAASPNDADKPQSTDGETPPVSGITATKLMHPDRAAAPLPPLPAEARDNQPTVLKPAGPVERLGAPHGGGPSAGNADDSESRNTHDLRLIFPGKQSSVIQGIQRGSSAVRPAAPGSGSRPVGMPPDAPTAGASATEMPKSEAPDTQQMPFAQLTMFGRYQLIHAMASGGFGEVWVARDGRAGREVVLKRLKLEHAESKRAFYQFDMEIEIGAKVKHPNLAPVLDSGIVEGRRYFTMPRIDGPSLTKMLNSTAGAEWQLSRKELLGALEGVCRALGFLHRAGVVHCDIKPDNILFETRVRPVLIDLGIARTVNWEQTGYRALKGFREDTSVLGTPEYMAPEMYSGDGLQIGFRSDLYSVGVILYEILSGQLPFVRQATDGAAQSTTSILEMAQRIKEEAPPPLKTLVADVPADLSQLTMRCLAKDYAERPESADDIAVALARYLRPLPGTQIKTKTKDKDKDGALSRLTRLMRNRGK